MVLLRFQQNHLDITDVFPDFISFGNHEGVGEHCILIQALSFSFYRWSQSRRSWAFHWLLKRRVKPNQKQLMKRSQKKTVQVGTSSSLPRSMYYKINCTVLCDGSYIMIIPQACCPWFSERFQFKMHTNMIQVFHLNCLIDTIDTCVRVR